MAQAIQTVTELRERAARRASGDMSETEFHPQFSALLARVPPHTIRESAFFSLPANRPPWFDTGLSCREGEDVTVFAAGRAHLPRELDIWLKPSFWLWYRLGEQGNLFRGTRCSHDVNTHVTETPDLAKNALPYRSFGRRDSNHEVTADTSF